MQIEATSESAATSATSSGALELDSQAFLTLLVTQLQHQDPLNPINNEQLVVQLSQLSEVESVRAMQTSLESIESSLGGVTDAGALGSAAALIGKTVAYQVDGVAQTGIVGSINVSGTSGMVAVVDGSEVPLGQITGISAPNSNTED